MAVNTTVAWSRRVCRVAKGPRTKEEWRIRVGSTILQRQCMATTFPRSTLINCMQWLTFPKSMTYDYQIIAWRFLKEFYTLVSPTLYCQPHNISLMFINLAYYVLFVIQPRLHRYRGQFKFQEVIKYQIMVMVSCFNPQLHCQLFGTSNEGKKHNYSLKSI